MYKYIYKLIIKENKTLELSWTGIYDTGFNFIHGSHYTTGR